MTRRPAPRRAASQAETRAITPGQMRERDRVASEVYAIPSYVLMEHAGRGVADVATLLAHRGRCASRAMVLVGPGNNGGDGLVAARWLHARGWRVRIITPEDWSPRTDDARRAHAIARASDLPISAARTLPRTTSGTLVIDALLGTGLSRPPEEPIARLIRAANRARARGCHTLAIDVPSGLDAATGVPHDPTILADTTAVLAAFKHGLLAPAARAFVGRTHLVEIGFPRALMR